MVQSEIFNRVFRLIYGNSGGTTFTIEHNNMQFLVTAKHIFEKAGYPDSGTISLLIEGQYAPLEVEIRYPVDPHIDIAVMKSKDNRFISRVYNNSNTSKGLIWGQDVFFLGFPYEYDRHLKSFPNSKTPVPFVKKACFSGALDDGHSCILLDGHNNKGFSGGPVCFKPVDSAKKTMSIAAVVSGYRFEKQKVFDKNDQETESYIKSNTGIIVAYDIQEAIEIAKHWNT